MYRKEIPGDTPFFLQIKDEEWFGEFVDVSPSKTEIATKSILKVCLKSPQWINGPHNLVPLTI